MTRLTRRGVLAGSAAAGVIMTTPAVGKAVTANPAGLRLLTSIDGMNVPPKGVGQQKFSFANLEPSVEFAGFLFAFEVITFENNYTIDPSKVQVERTAERVRLLATGFQWAGGQEAVPGRLVATLERLPDGMVEWDVEASLDTPVKAIKTVVRGLPRGKVSVAADAWRDLYEDEQIFEYPALMGGMATPFIAIKRDDERTWGISALQTEVRPVRFGLFPGPDGYKADLVYEQAGWDKRQQVRTCRWRVHPARDFAEAAAAHFASVKENWYLPNFQNRPDAPEWMKHLSLVLTLHGQHWTGYVHNDFTRQLEILRWIARQIDPTTVMIFLAGWDGRYYWDYPAFEIGKRTGGEGAFDRLIKEGKKLGFRFALMFGSNVANPASPEFGRLAEARIRSIYGDYFPGNYVDWDGDRKADGSMVFMNLAVESWRNHLKERISALLGRYPIDAYFLDICGLWENNLEGDMLTGTRRLVDDLAKCFPGIPAIAEMQYDAQMAFIPMNHVPRYPLYPQASYGVVASFNHLSWPAPGRGSTGVHEYGFGTYKSVTVDQPQLPTITFVDTTFSQQRDAVMRDVATAKRRFAARGGRT